MLRGGAAVSPIGVELGEGSVRMVQLAGGLGRWRLQAAGCARLDPKRQDAAAEALRWLLASRPFKGRRAVVAMADKLIDTVPLRLSLEEDDLEAGLLKEVANYLPYPLEEAVVDYCVFDDQRLEKGLVRVLVFAARRQQVDRHLAALEAAGLDPVAMDASPFALQRLCHLSGGDSPGKLFVLGLGGLYSSLVVLWDHKVFLQRIVPWGIEAMAGAFVANLGLAPELATKVLSRFDFSAPEAGQETLAQVGAGELRKLVAEMERVLLYCASEMRGVGVDEIVLAGDCQAIRGLGGFLEGALGVPARVLQPFAGLEHSRGSLPVGLEGREACLAVAAGLALREGNGASG